MTGPIDVHTHIFPRRWDDWAGRYGGRGWPRLVGDPDAGCTLYLGETFNRNLEPEAFDPVRRIADLDRLGIAIQVLSPPPPMFCYGADGPAASEFCRMQNDAIAEIVARHPERFLGAGVLPLQAPALAVKELERVAATLGFRCVEIGTHVDGRDLDDAGLDPVWEAAAALDVAIFVHPSLTVLGQERVQRDKLTQVVGNPLETALAMSRIIYGGIVERWPGLRWCFAHGGGAFAFGLGRLDHGWRVMPEGRAAVQRAPSEYAKRFWVDSLTHSPRALRFNLDVYGAGHVVLGSDYPFRMGTPDPLEALDTAGLDAATRRCIAIDNARAFLRLP